MIKSIRACITAMTIMGLFLSCSGGRGEQKLVVFHAGSLSVPFSEIADAFSEQNGGVEVELEAAGSRTCARKITELNRECDVMASADYEVIDQLLIPDAASWNIRFAANEMAIAFDKGSEKAAGMDQQNWYTILQRDDVAFGRSDPDSDPCGYRTVLTLKLAEKHYGEEGLADRILQKDREYIRAKETDLLGLLEAGALDFIFIYRSVARQHGLAIMLLPDEINLKDPALADYYSSVSIKLSGKKPGEFIERKGGAMVYGVTIPNNAPSPGLALKFVQFLLDPQKGLKIMERNGQPPLIPARSDSREALPPELKRLTGRG